jgi:hypothetical protein
MGKDARDATIATTRTMLTGRSTASAALYLPVPMRIR